MKLAIACDHGAYALKEVLKVHLAEQGHEVKDFGTNSLDSCDYPDFAGPAALAVASGECEKGIVLCTTGIGVSITANKANGAKQRIQIHRIVRAEVCLVVLFFAIICSFSFDRQRAKIRIIF